MTMLAFHGSSDSFLSRWKMKKKGTITWRKHTCIPVEANVQSTQCPAIHTKAVVEKKQKILALMGSQQVVLGNPKNLLFLFNAFSWTANSVCVNRISIQREKESTALFVQAKKNYTERLESRETPLNWMARRGSLSFRLVLTVPPTKGGSYVITVPLLIIILRAYLLIFLLRLFPKFSMSKQLEKYRELSLSHLFVPIPSPEDSSRWKTDQT